MAVIQLLGLMISGISPPGAFGTTPGQPPIPLSQPDSGAAPVDALASRVEIFNGYTWVLVVSFVVSLLATPMLRRLAVANGIVDRPSDPRKIHRIPIAYMGGVAVFVGIIAGIFYSYVATVVPGMIDFHASSRLNIDGILPPVPLHIIIAMTIVVIVGLIDDVTGLSPRVKVGGLLLAAAALAIDDVGAKVAAGVLSPIGEALFGNPELAFRFTLPGTIPLVGNTVTFDVTYWVGTAIIGIFVVGATNATNLIDGLDGLLSGVTAIAAAGLLVIACTLALADDGPRDGQRLILCMAVLGGCLGFLPHNFNPANIFLGDAGSLLLGFSIITIILTLGDTGKTHLVLAGLIVFALPIIDTSLAIVRRKLEGKSISAADSNHLHHMLKRALGVKGAVLALYGMGVAFAALGVAISMGRARVIYALTLIIASFIAVTAIKIARKKQIEEEAAAFEARRRAAGHADADEPSAVAERDQNDATPATAAQTSTPAGLIH